MKHLSKTPGTVSALCFVVCLVVSAAFAAESAAGENSGMSIKRAGEIAIANVGGGKVVKEEVETKRDGSVVYEIGVLNQDVRYKVTVDEKGNVVNSRAKKFVPGVVKYLEKLTGRDEDIPTPRLDIGQVVDLAKKEIGDGVVTEYNLSNDRGYLLHEVAIAKDGYEFEVEVRDDTGAARKSGLDMDDYLEFLR